ncbi:MAG: ABC transporter substrate-binding protein [Chromatiales bacterium]|jgi:phospholipid transport system substrate-binding protein|nr:ABC transporter substrate-binding protein [Chromatiales bacterium]
MTPIHVKCRHYLIHGGAKAVTRDVSAVHAINGLVATAVLLALLLFSPDGRGESAHDFVLEAVDKVLTTASQSPVPLTVGSPQSLEIARTQIGPLLDLERISRLAIGRHWRGASASERARFVAAFRVLVLRDFADAIARLTDFRLVLLPQDLPTGSRRIVVKTRAVSRNDNAFASVDIEFVVRRTASSWTLVDYSVNGVSALRTYRAEFAPAISRKGMAGLIDALNERAGDSD